MANSARVRALTRAERRVLRTKIRDRTLRVRIHRRYRHADCLSGVFRRRKRVREVGEAFRRLRACYPKKQLFVIMDNLRNVHDHPTFTALLRRLRIHPVYTPTEASWLNAIEAHFGATKRATLVGSDDRDHRPRRRRIYRYLRYRNRRVGQEAHPLTRIRSVRPIKLDRH